MTTSGTVRESTRITAAGRGRRAIAALALLLAVLGTAAPADAREAVIILSGDARPYRETEALLARNLRAQGFQTRSVLLEELTDQSLRDVPDERVHIAVGTRAAVAVNERLPRQAALTYCMVSNPGAYGLTTRERTAGVSINVPVVEQFRLIREGLPNGRKIGMLYRSDVPQSHALMLEAQEALPRDWELQAVAIDAHETFADAVTDLLRSRPDVIWTAPDTSVYDTVAVRTLLLAALRNDKPVFGFSVPAVRAGALFGIGIDLRDQGIKAAALTQRLTAEPVVGPTDDAPQAIDRHQHASYDIAINLIVAENIRVQLPESLVRRAQHIIEMKREDGP